MVRRQMLGRGRVTAVKRRPRHRTPSLLLVSEHVLFSYEIYHIKQSTQPLFLFPLFRFNFSYLLLMFIYYFEG